MSNDYNTQPDPQPLYPPQSHFAQQPIPPQSIPPQPAYGYGYPPPPAYAHPKPSNGLGTAGMVCGIVGVALFWFPFVGFVLCLVATALSAVGLRRATGDAPTATNKGMAVTGLVLGIVGVAPALLFMIAVLSA
jgi:hypothetical protein